MLCNSDEVTTYLIVCLKWKHFCVVCRDKMSWQLGCVCIIDDVGLMLALPNPQNEKKFLLTILDSYVVLCSQFLCGNENDECYIAALTFNDGTFDWYEVGLRVACTKAQVVNKRSKSDCAAHDRAENHQWKSHFYILAHFLTQHMTIPDNSLFLWIYWPFEKPQWINLNKTHMNDFRTKEKNWAGLCILFW